MGSQICILLHIVGTILDLFVSVVLLKVNAILLFITLYLSQHLQIHIFKCLVGYHGALAI